MSFPFCHLSWCHPGKPFQRWQLWGEKWSVWGSPTDGTSGETIPSLHRVLPSWDPLVSPTCCPTVSLGTGWTQLFILLEYLNVAHVAPFCYVVFFYVLKNSSLRLSYNMFWLYSPPLPNSIQIHPLALPGNVVSMVPDTRIKAFLYCSDRFGCVGFRCSVISSSGSTR